jgi:hypothetical protein
METNLCLVSAAMVDGSDQLECITPALSGSTASGSATLDIIINEQHVVPVHPFYFYGL